MVMYTMYFSFRTAVLDCALLWHCQLYILCHIRISHYDGFIPGCLNISLVFRTAVLDYVLLEHCQLCILCIFGHSLNMGLSFIMYGLK